MKIILHSRFAFHGILGKIISNYTQLPILTFLAHYVYSVLQSRCIELWKRILTCRKDIGNNVALTTITGFLFVSVAGVVAANAGIVHGNMQRDEAMGQATPNNGPVRADFHKWV